MMTTLIVSCSAFACLHEAAVGLQNLVSRRCSILGQSVYDPFYNRAAGPSSTAAVSLTPGMSVGHVVPVSMPGEDKSPSCPGWNTAANVTPKQAAIQLVTKKMPKVHAAVRPMPAPACPSAQTDAIIQPATSGKTSIFRLLIISSPGRPGHGASIQKIKTES